MDGREQILPLTLGALLAVTLHVLFVAWSAQGLAVPLAAQPPEPAHVNTIPPQPVVELKPPVERKIQLGDDDGVNQLALAWISYDDFQALQARQARVVQPAVQEHVLPLEHAPIEPDPTPPMTPVAELLQSDAAVEQGAEPTLQTESHLQQAGQTNVIAVNPTEQGPDSTQDAARPRAIVRAPASDGVGPQPIPAPQNEVRSPDPQSLGQTRATKRVSPKAPNPRASKTSPKHVTTPARPTAAPKDDKESDPFDLTASQRVVPGGVVVRQGIEIQTVKPKFGIATRVSALPSNPTVKVRFSRDGRVIKAWITHSSGYQSVDVPIVKSLYKWRAKGKQLAELGRSFEVQIHLILVTDAH